MDTIPNTRIRELCGEAKGVDGIVDESIFRYFGHIERMEKERIPKWVHMRECVTSHSGRTFKRSTDSVN